MPSENRMQRINEEVLRELSRLVTLLKDPRLEGLFTLTHVEVTNDLEHAKVFVSVLDWSADSKSVMDGLNSAAGFLRLKLAHALTLRRTPSLRFIADDSLARGARVLELLSKSKG